jgi:quinol monooxygenase YgiN
MIHVIATIELHPETRERFLLEFGRLVPQVRGEQGCIEYGAATDLPSGLPAQVPIRPNGVTVVEKWSSLEALSAHLASPHMKAYRERVKAFVVRTTLQVLAPATDPAP